MVIKENYVIRHKDILAKLF